MGVNLNNPNNPNTILGMLQALQQQHGVQPAQQPALHAGPILHQPPAQDEFVQADALPPADQVVPQGGDDHNQVVPQAADMEVEATAIEPEPVVADDAQDNAAQHEPLPPLPAAPVVHAQPVPGNLLNNMPPLDLGAGVINPNNQALQLPPLDLHDQNEDE